MLAFPAPGVAATGSAACATGFLQALTAPQQTALGGFPTHQLVSNGDIVLLRNTGVPDLDAPGILGTFITLTGQLQTVPTPLGPRQVLVVSGRLQLGSACVPPSPPPTPTPTPTPTPAVDPQICALLNQVIRQNPNFLLNLLQTNPAQFQAVLTLLNQCQQAGAAAGGALGM